MSTTLIRQTSRDIVAIGFRREFDRVVYGNTEAIATPAFFESTFKAFRYLEQRLEKSDLPLAIIFEFEFLASENFELIKALQSNTKLASIPIIGISDSEDKIDPVFCLKNGIDDVYSRPISWRALYRRVEFLNRYKASFIEQSKVGQEDLPKLTNWPKRIFDIVFAASVLILIGPFLLLIAFLIKLESPGPVIYRSKRVGRGYQIFDFLKFRSMVVDADEKLEELAHLNHYTEGEEATFVKLQNDPRITRIGKFIRKTSIDELPQLFNVLRGEMSIVGNRPLPMYEAEEMVRDDWAKRFLAPAGLTGLWQVSPLGKDNLTSEQRVQLDIDYADRSSLWLDIQIITKTLPAMLQKCE
ncbi:MAG: sugar transferase [Saprospiraceae bacterium]|nr:sugar transferase [Saprospiraceae bacterium]